jgi:hypothetical protein
VLAAVFALPLSDHDQAIVRALAARQPPTRPVRELWAVCGRRAGKSAVAALVAVYLATCRTYKLAPGERGVFMVIASDRRQARVVRRYITGLVHASPVLEQLIERETRDAVDFTNGVTIEIQTASFRAVRGYTVVGAVLDEVAFWPVEDAANPDKEILAALRPAMATQPDALLLALSSPYARRGELYRTWRDHYGKESDVLVIQAATRALNPAVDESVIARAYEEDEVSASAEYGAQFRRDIEGFVSREVVDAVTVEGRAELPPMSDADYYAFVDPSGGSADAFTLAIAHRDAAADITVLDLVRERRPPFSPEAVAAEFARVLKAYRVSSVVGDRYAGEWPREQFRKHGIGYEPAARPKSELYRDVLPLLNSRRVELLDLPRLRAQLVGLERRTARGGRDSIDHAPGSHDDVVNAAVGALLDAATVKRRVRMGAVW